MDLLDGSWIFLAFIVLTFIALVFGFYTIRGSGINEHPSDGVDGQAPGARGPSHRSGQGRVPGNPNDSSAGGSGMAAGDAFSTRGTGSSKRRS